MTTPRRNHVDLHCHSAQSDGVLEPLVLVDAMRRWGIRVAALTDHDTLAGFRELRDAGVTGGSPRLLPGVEINCLAEDMTGRPDGELHILGIGVDPDDTAFETVLAGQRAARQERTAEMVSRLRAAGMPIDDALAGVMGAGVSAPGRPHVARALVAAGFAESVDDAMRRILSPGSPAYVPRRGLGPRDAIEAIRRAGGIASLAHFREAPERRYLIARLQAWGLGALEVYYVSFDEPTVGRMARFAADLGLLATGGSDYHGDTWTYAQAQDATNVPDEVADRFLAALALD